MSDEFVTCPTCGRLTNILSGHCKHCGQKLQNTHTDKLKSVTSNSRGLFLLILVIIVTITSILVFVPIKNDDLLKQSLSMIDNYYQYYNDEDYDKIKTMLYDKVGKNGNNFADNNLRATKESRILSGKYLENKYPDDPIKLINYPKDQEALNKYSQELARKYGNDIFEDNICFKNSYQIIESAKGEKVISICITQRFDNGENHNVFVFKKTSRGPKIVLVPTFYVPEFFK